MTILKGKIVKSIRKKKSKKIKAPKKISKRTQLRKDRKKLLNEWKQAIKLKDKGACIVCGFDLHHIHVHHILPADRYPEFKYEIMNGVTLCAGHHKYKKFSAHKNGIWFYDFLSKTRPEQLKWALEHMGNYLISNTEGI